MCQPTIAPSKKVDGNNMKEQILPKKKRNLKIAGGGIENNKREIEFGLLAISIVYGLVYKLNPPISPADEFCIYNDDDKPCRRSDLVAYKVTCALSMTYMGLSGVKNWHFNPIFQQLAPGQKNENKTANTTPEDRLFGSIKAADLQNVVILCYQMWDFVLSLTIPEHRSQIIFLVHHLLAIFTAYFSLENQMVGYYSVFYGGCSEFSSIFLVMTDLDEKFPSIFEGDNSDHLEVLLLICKVCFVLTFFHYRVYGWIKHSIPLWMDTLHVIQTGSAEIHRPGKTNFLYAFLALNVVLGALQLYWFSQIISAIIDMVS